MGLKGMFGARHAARRVAAVNAYEFSSSVRQRLRLKHPGLGPEHLALVQDAARQWFRLVARLPSARLAMPSRLVDDLWHEMVLHTREYAAFCDTAFGRFLHHEPESAMPAGEAAANRSEHLLRTLRLAQQDENRPPDQLPLLFRVDSEVGLDGARHYVADCGGHTQCHSHPGTLCLRHLARPPHQHRGAQRAQVHRSGSAPPQRQKTRI